MTKPPRLPPPKINTQQATQSTQTNPVQPPSNEAEVKEKLEKARVALQHAILAYKDLLQKTQLSANRSTEDTRLRNKVIVDIHDLSGQLDFLNAGEGLMTMCITALHSSLLLKDEINDLKFQNAILNKKIKSIASDKEVSG